MIYIYQIGLLLFTIIMGIHDGQTNAENRAIPAERKKWWHFTGVVAYSLFSLALIDKFGWPIIASCLLIRFGFFDLGYNSQLKDRKLGYLGDNVEGWERLMIKIFGPNGGLIKAAVALAVLATLNILHALKIIIL